MSASAVLPELAAPASRIYRIALQIAILLALAAVVYATLGGAVARLIGKALYARSLDPSLVRLGVVWVSLGVVMLVARTLLWLAYRPQAAVDYDAAPAMTVVIPAYNE